MLMIQTYTKLVELVDRLITTKFPMLKDAFHQVERQTKIKRIYLIHGIVAACLASLAVGQFNVVTRQIVLHLYPAHGTVEALQSKDTSKYVHWLSYWAVFAFLAALEPMANSVLSIVPFYDVLKFLFIAWCYAPIEKNGSKLILKRYIMPISNLFKKNSLDEIGSNAIDKISETLKIKKGQSVVKNQVEKPGTLSVSTSSCVSSDSTPTTSTPALSESNL